MMGHDADGGLDGDGSGRDGRVASDRANRDERHISDTIGEYFDVLEAAPGFASVLGWLVDADRQIARAIDVLADLDSSAIVEATGVGANQWMAIVARRTTSDVRMIMTSAKVCRRVPSLRAGFVAGRLSWAQVRAVALVCHRLPTHLDDSIDGAVASVVNDDTVDEPNAVVWAVRQALASVEPGTVTEPDSVPSEFLAMQPRGDGHGGQLFGEMGAQAWAVVDAALNTRTGTAGAVTVDNRPDAGRRRLDRLVSLLDATLSGDNTTAATGTADASGTSGTTGTADTTGGAQATGLCGPPAGKQGPAEPGRGMRSRPQLLVRAELDALLSRRDVPGVLLTGLLGGKVWMDAASTRRMIDERGADLRTVIIEAGRVVGVGRRTRVPPGWLSDALLAIHDTCCAPGCDAPARSADIDHAIPWHPARPTDRPGRTDIDQLAPVCAHHNRRKERDGWRVVQHPDHTRTWSHPRSGLSTTTAPSTWQPANWVVTEPPTTACEQPARYETWQAGSDPPISGRQPSQRSLQRSHASRPGSP